MPKSFPEYRDFRKCIVAKLLVLFLIQLGLLSCLENSEQQPVKRVPVSQNDLADNSDDLTGSEEPTKPSDLGQEDDEDDTSGSEQEQEDDSSTEDEGDTGNGDDSSEDSEDDRKDTEEEQEDEEEPIVEIISNYYVYVGANDRILHYELNQDNGALTEKSQFELNNNPGNMALQIAVGKDQKFMYVGTERSNSIHTLAINPDNGNLTFISVLDLGYKPVYLHVDDTGKSLIVSSYESNKVEVFPIQADGQLSFDMNDRRELMTGERAHSVITSPNNNFIIFPNTGASNANSSRLQGADFDPVTSTIDNVKDLTDLNSLGPRHIRFHPKLDVFYAVNEYANSVTWYSWDSAGKNLSVIDSILTLDASTGSHTSADMHITSDGRFLYASNRGLNGTNHSIAMFSVNEVNGSLSQIDGARVPTVGKPREFAIDPLDKYLFVVGRDDNMLQSYTINQDSGLLVLLGDPISLATSPTWIEVVTLSKEVISMQ